MRHNRFRAHQIKEENRMGNWPGTWRDIEQRAKRECAVYRIRLVKNTKPLCIPRFLKADKEGVLCIGYTSNMETRRKRFKRGYLTCKGHSEGNLLYLLREYSGLRRKYPQTHLEYQYMKKSSKAKSKGEEERLIKKYVKRYGEAPPLNSSIPKRDNQRMWRKA